MMDKKRIKKAKQAGIYVLGVVVFVALGYFINMISSNPQVNRIELEFNDPATKKAIFMPTNEFIAEPLEWENPVVFEKYRPYDKERDEFIDLNPAQIKGFFTRHSSHDFVTIVDLENSIDKDLSLQVTEDFAYPYNIWPWPRPGEYSYLIKLKDGRVYATGTKWEEAPKPATLVKESVRKEGNKTLLSFRVTELSLDNFQAMFHIKPNKKIDRIYPTGEDLFWVVEDSLENGEHMFLIKYKNTWHEAIATYPEDFN